MKPIVGYHDSLLPEIQIFNQNVLLTDCVVLKYPGNILIVLKSDNVSLLIYLHLISLYLFCPLTSFSES